MKVLYIEDDIIDQMAMKRLAEKCSCEIEFANSIQEASNVLGTINYDLIITDFYLGDGTAEDILSLVTNQRIVLITEKPLDTFNANGNSLFTTTKPFNESIFKIVNHSEALDLTYFHSLTEGDTQFQIELLDTAMSSIPSSLDRIKFAMNTKNFAALKFEAHKMKSGARIMGIKILDELSKIEDLALREDSSKLASSIESLNNKLKVGIELVKIERSKLQ